MKNEPVKGSDSRIPMLIFVAVFGVLMASSGMAQAIDQVVQKDGSTVKGTVTSLSLSSVSIKKSDGSTQTIDQSKVDRIIYGDTTPALGEARRALSEKRYKVAIQQGKRALQQVDSGQLRSLHRPRAVDFVTTAYFKQGAFQKAIDLIKEQRAKGVDHPRFYSIARTMVLSTVYSIRQRGAEEFDRVIKTVSRWKRRASKYNATDHLKARLKLLGAEAREEFGEYEKAKAKYDAIRDSDFEEIARLATSGYFRCMVRSGENIGGAVENFERLLDGPFEGDPLIRSGYLNAKGEQYKKKWKDQKDSPALLRKALFSFLKASVLTSTKPSDPTIQKRQSVLNAARTYEALAENGPKKGQSFFNKQARNTYRELTEVYPRTPESIQAKKHISN